MQQAIAIAFGRLWFHLHQFKSRVVCMNISLKFIWIQACYYQGFCVRHTHRANRVVSELR